MVRGETKFNTLAFNLCTEWRHSTFPTEQHHFKALCALLYGSQCSSI